MASTEAVWHMRAEQMSVSEKFSVHSLWFSTSAKWKEFVLAKKKSNGLLFSFAGFSLRFLFSEVRMQMVLFSFSNLCEHIWALCDSSTCKTDEWQCTWQQT